MKSNNFIAGLIAGIIGFIVNILVQFLIEQKINFLTALGTGFGLFVVFALITSRYTR